MKFSYTHLVQNNVKETTNTIMQLLFSSGAARRPVLLLQDLCLHRSERRLCAGQT